MESSWTHSSAAAHPDARLAFSLEAAAASGRVNQCIIRTYQHVLGGKWKLLILSYLLDGTRRYGEMRRLIPEISEKMLIQELRDLEAQHLVQRIQYPEVPPRVEYQLTQLGQALLPVFQALLAWSGQYLDAIGPQAATAIATDGHSAGGGA